jgi:hypothetical protein
LRFRLCPLKALLFGRNTDVLILLHLKVENYFFGDLLTGTLDFSILIDRATRKHVPFSLHYYSTLVVLMGIWFQGDYC